MEQVRISYVQRERELGMRSVLRANGAGGSTGEASRRACAMGGRYGYMYVQSLGGDIGERGTLLAGGMYTHVILNLELQGEEVRVSVCRGAEKATRTNMKATLRGHSICRPRGLYVRVLRSSMRSCNRFISW